MSLKIYHPGAPLNSYVDMIWHWENYAPPHSHERILPVGQTELTFNLSGHHFSPDDRAVVSSPVILIGCQSEYFVIDTSRPTTLLSVLFKPGASLDVFNISAKELHNQIVSLTDIRSTEADGLYNLLMETSSVDTRFHILERTLLKTLRLNRQRHAAVDFALATLSSASVSTSIADLQVEVALSPPRFIQLFRDEIGYTPKLYSRLQRFHRVLDAIASQDNVDWADLALCTGYYDQAHLINDFRKFAGISPSAYTPLSKEHNKNIPYFAKT